jgi:hypothetical protein
VLRGIGATIGDEAAPGPQNPVMDFAERAARNEETIDIAPYQYAAIVQERYRFVVVSGHEEPEVERIVANEPQFVIVEKIGEARRQIDRDHP